MIKKIWDWLCSHKDWAHFLGGLGFGLFLGFPAALAAAVTSEAKDVQWGGAITVMDAVITCAGGLIGGAVNVLVLLLIF